MRGQASPGMNPRRSNSYEDNEYERVKPLQRMNKNRIGIWLIASGIWLWVLVSEYNKSQPYWKFTLVIIFFFVITFSCDWYINKLESKLAFYEKREKRT